MTTEPEGCTEHDAKEGTSHRPHARRHGVKRSLRVPQAAVLLLVGLICIALRWQVFLPDPEATKDFPAYYRAAFQLGAGLSPYNPDWLGRPVAEAVPARYRSQLSGRPYENPPLWGQLFIPFTALELRTAIIVWHYTQFLLMGIAVGLICAAVPATSRKAVGGVLVLLAVLGEPFASHLHCTQAMLLVAVTVACGLLAAVRGQQTAAGAALALGTALKVTPLLYLASCASRRWGRSLQSFPLALVSIVVLSGGVSGMHHWTDFATKVIRKAEMSAPPWPTQSITGFWWLLIRGLDLGETAGLWLFRLSAIVLLMAALYFIVSPRRRARHGKVEDRQQLLDEWGVLSIVGVVTMPWAYPYHYVMLMFPVAAGVTRIIPQPRTSGASKLTFIAGVIMSHLRAFSGVRMMRILGLPQLVGALLLLVWLLAQDARKTDAHATN